jgi:hypothetical protein
MGHHVCQQVQEEHSFWLRVLRAADAWGPGCDAIWWRTDGTYAPVTFFVACNDVFVWGLADVETLTPANIDVFEKSVADCTAGAKHGEIYAGALFCARVRGMRPQGAAYPDERALWPLFDACGPQREIGLGNPYPPGRGAAP